MKITLFNKLRKYEQYLYSAQYANYIRAITIKDLEEIISVGDEIGIHYTYNHCPKCVLDFIKKMARPYFEQKEQLDKKAKEKQNEKDEQQKTNENGSKTTSNTRRNSKRK